MYFEKSAKVVLINNLIVTKTSIQRRRVIDYLVFFKTYRTIGLRVRNNPLTNIPKGFGSEMTLEVAEGRLQVAGLCMLKTHAFA